MFTTSFSIAGLGLHMTLPEPMEIDENFQPFLDAAARKDLTVRFQQTDHLPKVAGEPLFQNENFGVFSWENGTVRLFHDNARDGKRYAWSIFDRDTGTVSVFYLAQERQMFSSCRCCFSYIALEELLLSRDRLILHASFVSSEFGGILFSGPSGIGKSTQADLWKKLEGSTVINGDRPILGKVDGTWMAYGSPYAGSSQCYVNEMLPAAAIVMLEQGSTCEIRRLSRAEAFRLLYAQTVVNTWNSGYVQRVCDLLMALSADVPVYRMVCTPDGRAVETVKAALRERTER